MILALTPLLLSTALAVVSDEPPRPEEPIHEYRVLSPVKKTKRCPEFQEDHARFLRPDIAYGSLRADCHGDATRRPASEHPFCADGANAHAEGLRPDIAFAVTGRDCFGDTEE